MLDGLFFSYFRNRSKSTCVSCAGGVKLNHTKRNTLSGFQLIGIQNFNCLLIRPKDSKCTKRKIHRHDKSILVNYNF